MIRRLIVGTAALTIAALLIWPPHKLALANGQYTGHHARVYLDVSDGGWRSGAPIEVIDPALLAVELLAVALIAALLAKAVE